MALRYGLNNAVDFASSTLIGFASVLTRTAGQPLDKSQLWYPLDGKTGYERACEYAATSSAYVGQELAVVDVVYEEDGTTVKSTSVKFYGIQDEAGTLKELGAVPVGDESTISVDAEGRISLKGIESLVFERDILGEDEQPTGDKEVVKYQPLLTKDGLTWVEPSKTTVEGLATLISELENAVEELTEVVTANTDAITSEITARENADKALEDKIGTAAKAESSEGAGDAEEATGLYKVIEEALAEAKQYADDNDADTIYDDTDVKARIKAIEDDYLKDADKYDDTEVKADIEDHESRLNTIETAIGDSTQGIQKALADNAQAIKDEATAREQGDTTTLNSAKGYTDEQITGLDIVIEKKTVEDVESDYIVIKNKSGVEVASVNAAKFVKDGMLDAAEYSADTKKLTLTWNTDAGKSATVLDLNDLIDTYTGSEHIIVGADGVISLADDVALAEDIETLTTALNTKRTEAEVNAQIDAKIEAANLGQYAKASDMETALAGKANVSDVNSTVATLEASIATKAVKTEVESALETKLDKSTWESDKATFAIASEVAGEFETVGSTLENLAGNISTNATAISTLESNVAATYATKTELGTVEDKADSNASLITNLTGRLDGIVAQGGEPNVINNIKVNGVAQTIAEDKSVDIAVPVKVADLSDGQTALDDINTLQTAQEELSGRLTTAQNGIATLSNTVSGIDTRVTTLANTHDTDAARIKTLEDEVVSLKASDSTTAGEIVSLKAKDGELSGLIAANTSKFEDYYTKATIDTTVAGLQAAINNVDLSSRVDVETFESYQTSQAQIIATLAVKSEVEGTFETVNAEIAKKADTTALNDEIARAKAAEEKIASDLALLIENPTETLDSVKELITHVTTHGTDIAGIVSRLDGHDTAIANNKAAHEKNADDITALATTVAAQKIIDSTEISTTSVEGGVQLGINELNVNKLVQTTGDVLILNGGTSVA